MKRTFHIVAMIVFAAFACINLQSCKQAEKVEDLIVVDLSQEYPVLELELTDIADISYIPLKGKDSVQFLSTPSSFANNIHIDDEHIFIGDFSPYTKDGKWHRFNPKNGKLLLFDSKGNYLNTVFNSKNENETIMFGMKTPFAVVPEKGEIYAFSAYSKLIRKFNYKGDIISDSQKFEKEYGEFALLGDTIVLFDIDAQLILMNGNYKDKGATLKLYSTGTGEIIPHKGLPFAKPLNGSGSIADTKMTITGSGIYITTQRSDTVYHIDRNLGITPRFLSVRHYEEAHNLLYPLVETEDYILFCNGQDYLSYRNRIFKNANWRYLKREKQIYRLPCSNHFPEDNEEILWKNEFLLSCTHTTRNSNTLAAVMSVQMLKEKYNLLPPQLKSITDAAAEDDNPVLMVMRFGKKSLAKYGIN